MATTQKRGAIGGRGIMLVLFGLLLMLLSILGLPWYSVDSPGTDSAGNGFTFDDLKSNADQLSAPVASSYFDWLAWTLLVLVVVVGIAACVPSRAANPLRVAGFLLGVVGLVGTYYALAQLFNAQQVAGGSDHSVLHSSTFGMWFAMAGFALCALGAVLGPRRS